MMHSPSGDRAWWSEGAIGIRWIDTGTPFQSHFIQDGLSHSSSGLSGFQALSGVSRCEPHAGQTSGTPRMCWIVAETHRDTEFSVTDTAASASCHFELFVWVSQLENDQALSS